MADERRSEGEPIDRLTRICADMTKVFDSHPEHLPGDKCVVFLDSDAEQRGGLVMHGYDDDRDAVVNVFMHLRAVFRANGSDLVIGDRTDFQRKRRRRR